VAQGGRVLVVGFSTGKVKATNRTFEDNFVFAITVRNGKLTNIREYFDTQAPVRPAQMDAFGPASRLPSAASGSGSTVNEPWIAASPAARSSNAQP
jgi:hypothetical protein